jgi:hypothetical protein
MDGYKSAIDYIEGIEKTYIFSDRYMRPGISYQYKLIQQKSPEIRGFLVE